MEEKNKEPQINIVNQHEGEAGAVVGSIIVILIIIAGGIYFYSSFATNQFEDPTLEEDPQVEELKEQDDSDNISSIEADLESTELDELDKELEQIEEEFDNN